MNNDEQETREANNTPTKFEFNKWIEWEDHIIDYLSYVYNTREVPLRYGVRNYYVGNVADMTR